MKLFLSLSFIASTFVVYGQTNEQREVIKASMNSEIVQKTNNQVSALSLEREKKVAAYLKNNPEKKKSFTKEGKEYFLYNISKDGLPIYINTKDLPQVSNTKASTLYSGGSIGVAITGTNMVADVWDGGQANASNGFDIMTGGSASKNVITVGAINSNNLMSNYSNWGPTDDGRRNTSLQWLGMGKYDREYSL